MNVIEPNQWLSISITESYHSRVNKAILETIQTILKITRYFPLVIYHFTRSRNGSGIREILPEILQ